MQDFDAICRRAGGRRAYNSARQFAALWRRTHLLPLLGHWPRYGDGARLARLLGVSEATISRDLAALLAELHAADRARQAEIAALLAATRPRRRK